jgi:hypothetical protein
VNFFNQACQSGPFSDEAFGLCDDQNTTCAYVDATTPEKWTATVKNPGLSAVTFTAVDKCVIQDGDEPDRPRCDGMLTTDELLYLVELKDQRAHWLPQAIRQLESTVQFIYQHHAEELKRFRHKKAYACNKRGGAFKVVDHELKLRFFNQYGFRIDVQSTVVLLGAVRGTI